MTFHEDNQAYESWLRGQCDVVEEDLDWKHRRMCCDAFSFLRATQFRWARRIGEICPELAGAPAVLAVGDTHVENFGTWRDGDGRWVWGINDFDDAAEMPYPWDLVRLAASTRLAPGWSLGNREAAAAILEGYRDGLARPRPTLLDEDGEGLSKLAKFTREDRHAFARSVERARDAAPPPDVVRELAGSLPEGASLPSFRRWTKGLGSLGRPRYIAVAVWRGGRVVREAKALVPPAWHWAQGSNDPASRFDELAGGPSRSPDPFLSVNGRWVCRRVAPDSRKLNLDEHAGAKLTARVLTAMGREIGSVHAADADRASRVAADLVERPEGWLHQAARAAANAVKDDFREWTE
ncbi:MAG: DUF2252 domain-containing protein [Alphaproteobacteria bacterium]|nr:DUF2252 domain-containing protein [Alphaproteobacteria bacterium]